MTDDLDYLEPLTNLDRCDHRACGAQAFVRVHTTSGTLYWCGHHFVLVAEKLAPITVHVHDEREALRAEDQAVV